MSPEMINKQNKYDERIDIWSVGIVVYQIICKTKPFNGKNLEELFTNIRF